MSSPNDPWWLKLFTWFLKLLGFREETPKVPKPTEPQVFPRDPAPGGNGRHEGGIETTENGRVTVDPDEDPDAQPEPDPEEEPMPDPSPVTPQVRKVIDSILSLFETGRLPSPESYSTVTVLKDGAGISYGKHQSTDKSDSLDRIVFAYIDRGGMYADQLVPFIDKLENDETAFADPNNLPDWVKQLMSVLRDAGADLVMQAVQDEKYKQGGSLLTEFLREHPNNPRAGDARNLLGDCLFAMGRYKEAISEYEAFVQAHPEHPSVPQAMFRQGLAFIELGTDSDLEAARIFLDDLIEKYPDSPEAEKAMRKIEILE